MGRPVTRLAIAASLALLLLSALAALFSSTASAGEKAPGEPGGVGPVCFWSAQGPACVERAAGVSAADLDSPDKLLNSLLSGPTADERQQGLWSVIPSGTTLVSVDVRPGLNILVRLNAPLDALRELNPTTLESIVLQIGGTLEPLRWRELHIQVWDPIEQEFTPLAEYLPDTPILRKETETTAAEGLRPLVWAYEGQPPASGQGQPTGSLTGKTVYVSAGHGWTWSSLYHEWRTQRPPYPSSPYDEIPIIEDHNNAEAVNQYLLKYLWNAGALVWPVRERDMNGNKVVVDNESPGASAGYSETGAWEDGVAGAGYAGADYRYTSAVTDSATATAVWTAALPASGQYAVYVWYRPGEYRAPDADYTVHHAGGETTVAVDQRRHGDTWHYIGTYGFRDNEEARVTLSNQSTATSSVIVADAVRLGGGAFDDLTSIQTSATRPPHKPWWEVAAYYQTQRMGLDPGDWPYFNDVVARPMYARWEHADTGDDAVYVSWHTNGYNGYQWNYRGTLSIIHNGEGNPISPGSEALRDAIHTELVHDIQVGWDPTWPEYKRSMNLGELRELWDADPDNAIPGALIEVAYHDHPDDARTLKEPSFNQLAARAIYQGIVRYFEQRDDIDLPLLPEPPTHLAVRNVGGGRVRISWRPSLTDTQELVGGAAAGYRVYTSTDGIGWSNGIPVATTGYTLAGLSVNQCIFVRVSAVNDGGESFPTAVLGARVGSESRILVVNGFDRLNRTMIVSETDFVEGENARMFLDQMNGYDYIIQHGEAISYPFDSASNEAVSDSLVSLSDYTLVDWVLGEESAPDETLNAKERAHLAAFLDNGGALFLSGAEVGWHLDYVGDDADFYNTVLRADYAGDDGDTYEVDPVAGGIFDGLGSFRFDAEGMYDADYPDQIRPLNGSTATLTYQGCAEGTAAIQFADGCERLVYFGFPFETIRSEQRSAVMRQVLDFLDECLELPIDTQITSPAYGSAHNTLPPFKGTATVYSAALERVEVQTQRGDDQYWIGNGWGITSTWLTATGGSVWTYTLPITNDDEYRLSARAWTTDSISDTSPAETIFTYDTISPTSATLITPTGGITLSASTVRLEWQPVAPDSGSELAYKVKMDGQSVEIIHSVYTVTQVTCGAHDWGVQVLDAAGNRSPWNTSAFFISQHSLWLPLVMRDFEEGEGPDAGENVIVNGGFESSGGWVLNQRAAIECSQVYDGRRSMRVGIPPGDPGVYVYSSVSQTVTLPPGSAATLRLQVYPINEGDDADDLHYIWLFDQWEGYEMLDPTTTDQRVWELREYDLSSRLGQTMTLFIGTKNDGDDDTAALYVDEVELKVYP